MTTKLLDSVHHWRKKLDKSENDDVILNTIRKLARIPISLEILEVTHIGKCIRNLSKRNDIVGEKAKDVLTKWRKTFADPDYGKSQKENIRKKDIKSSSKHDAPQEQTVNNENISLDRTIKVEHKNKLKSLTQTSQQSAKYMNGGTLKKESSPLYNNEVDENKGHSNSMNYDPRADNSEAYNPECPELFRANIKIEKPNMVPVNTYKPSSLKRKEKNGEVYNKLKKIKVEHDTTSDFMADHKKSPEKCSKISAHKNESKESITSTQNEQSYIKVKSENDDTIKCKGLVDTGKTKSKESKKSKIIHSSEEFTSGCASFEDCLGFNDFVAVNKKKSSKPQSPAKPVTSLVCKNKPAEKNKATPDQGKACGSTGKKTGKGIATSSNSSPVGKNSDFKKPKSEFSIPKPANKLLPPASEIASTLPEIQPNYRPLPRMMDFYSLKKKEVLSNEEAIKFTSSRKEKTAVYSGRRHFYSEIPSLFECCTRVLIDNIDAIECLGNVPYFLIRPVLERCTPYQLFNIENFNNYLIDDTNELWEGHCKRDYKLLKPKEHETWRELYWRAHDEREKKLKSVTANISASMSKSNPVRQVKLAYVDSFAKPPRDVARRQAKHGTALPASHPVKTGPPSKSSPRPTAPAINAAASASNAVANNANRGGGSSNVPASFKKPKVAPLMAKTLKSMKMCFRR